MTRARIVAIVVALHACAPDHETASSGVIVLGQTFALRARTYVMDDPGFYGGTPEAMQYLTKVMRANDESLDNDLAFGLGGVLGVGAREPVTWAREGDRLAYDVALDIVMPGVDPAAALRVGDDGALTLDLRRRMRTNEGLVEDPLLFPGTWLPLPDEPDEPVPYGFERSTVTLTPRPVEDAWPDYEHLFGAPGDGTLDIDVHFGVVDEAGAHMAAARRFLEWLLANGYARRQDPGRRAEGEPTSGPYVRSIETPYGPVSVLVRVVFGRSWTPSDPTKSAGAQLLAERARASLATRDVVVFIGHNYGGTSTWTTGLLAGGDHVGVGAEEFRSLPLAGRSQIIVSEGCGTRVLGAELRQNPSASPADASLDLVASSTMAYVNSDHVARQIVELLASTDDHDRHRPRRYLETLFELQLHHPLPGGESIVRIVDLVDDNPHLHPYFDPTLRGRSCVVTEECGPGAACLPSREGRVCTPECGATEACGPDRECRWDPTLERVDVQHSPSEPRYCLDPR